MAKITIIAVDGTIARHADQCKDSAKAETKKFNQECLEIYEEMVTGKDGRINKVKKVRKVRPSDRVKDYKWQDFTIENLTAVGADSMLRKSVLYGDVDDTIANMNAQLDAFEMVEAEAAVSAEVTE